MDIKLASGVGLCQRFTFWLTFLKNLPVMPLRVFFFFLCVFFCFFVYWYMINRMDSPNSYISKCLVVLSSSTDKDLSTHTFDL